MSDSTKEKREYIKGQMAKGRMTRDLMVMAKQMFNEEELKNGLMKHGFDSEQ